MERLKKENLKYINWKSIDFVLKFAFFYKNQLNNEEESEPILRRVLRQMFHITDQNQLFINDLIESTNNKKKGRI